MGAGAAPMQSAEQSVKRSRRIQKYSLLLKTPAHANTHHTPRGVFRGPEATAEGTGGQNHCREEEPEWGPEPRPCKQRRSQCKEQNTKSLTLYGVHLPTQTHTPHTPKGLSGAGSHGRGNRGLEPRPGGLWTEAAAESSRSVDPITLRAV